MSTRLHSLFIAAFATVVSMAMPCSARAGDKYSSSGDMSVSGDVTSCVLVEPEIKNLALMSLEVLDVSNSCFVKAYYHDGRAGKEKVNSKEYSIDEEHTATGDMTRFLKRGSGQVFDSISKEIIFGAQRKICVQQSREGFVDFSEKYFEGIDCRGSGLKTSNVYELVLRYYDVKDAVDQNLVLRDKMHTSVTFFKVDQRGRAGACRMPC